MRVVIGGTRGSFPVAQPGYLRYGGETTSILIEGERGERVLIDAGTGVRSLGQRLRRGAAREVLLLITHFHLDHVVGLPALGLLYDPAWRVVFAAPRRRGHEIARDIGRLFSPPLWPLRLEQLAAKLEFRNLSAGPATDGFSYGGFLISWATVDHPAGCWSYRLEEVATGASLVFATDVEWPRMGPAAQERWLRWASAGRPVDLLLFDGQYTPQTYRAHRGWGHSRWTDAVEVAHRLGVRRLLVIHHAPEHDDRALLRVERRVRAVFARGALARQGQVLELGRRRATSDS